MPNTTTAPATDDTLPAVDYPEPNPTASKAVVKGTPVARVSSGGTPSSTFWAINDRIGRGTNIFNIGWPGVEINSARARLSALNKVVATWREGVYQRRLSRSFLNPMVLCASGVSGFGISANSSAWPSC
jgi:hypothetical protein